METEFENKHFELTQLIQQSTARSALQFALAKLKSAYGLETIAYFGLNIKPDTKDDPYLAVTYSSEWVNRYIEQNYVSIDPVVKEGFTSVLPIDWSLFDRRSPKVQAFFGEAHEFGVGKNGVTIPVRGRAGDRALITLTRDQNSNDWSKDLAFLMRDFQILASNH